MLDASIIQRAATGNPDAIESLITQAGPAVRLFIAAYYFKPSAILLIERDAWKLIIKQLPHRPQQMQIDVWLARIVATPIRSHLQAVDQRAISAADTLTHQAVQECLQALDQFNENDVLTLPKRFSQLAAPIRNLMEQRYRQQRSLDELAKGVPGGQGAVAVAILTARAQCDWRELAKPPSDDDKMMASLIEEWLTDTIDADSRALLTNHVGRNLERAAQVMRQMRVHVALATFFKPFTTDEVRTLARLATESEGDSVILGTSASSGTSSQSVVKQVHSSGRLGNQSPRQSDSRHMDIQASRSSPLPWIISGILVLGGAVGLIALSMNNRPKPVADLSATNSADNAQPQHQNPVQTTSTTPTQNTGPAVAVTPPPQPGVSEIKIIEPTKPLQVMMVKLNSNQRFYARTRISLQSILSNDDGAEKVEYRHGDEVLGTAEAKPWDHDWEAKAGQFSITANAIKDGKVIATSEPIAIQVQPAFGSGSITREWWKNIKGDYIADAAVNSDWPLKPEGTETISNFETRRNWGDNYTQHIRGYIIPPYDGTYRFWIAADDEGELWLSTDESPLNVKRICVSHVIPGTGTGHRQWNRFPEQKSADITLRAEQRYYIEARHKEGGGADHISVMWQLPNGEMQGPILGVHLSPLNGDEPPAAIPVTPRSNTPPDQTSGPTVATTPLVPIKPPEEKWHFVQAINLGGDDIKLDEQSWSGQRKAEFEGATPENSVQPGPFVDELNWISFTSYQNRFGKNLSNEKQPITIDGRRYTRGLGVHAPSEIVYQLEGKYAGITGFVGVDDAAKDKNSSVIFQVFADGKKVWDSGIVNAAGPAVKMEVPLVGCKEMRLVVDPNRDNGWDHADWADVRMVVRGGNDGALVVQNGRKTMKRLSPADNTDKDFRAMLSTVLVGNKEGLSFRCKSPNGTVRVTLWIGENGINNSRSSDFIIEGQTLSAIGEMKTNEWQKVGPITVNVTDGYVDIQATPIKGTPQVMGVMIERQEIIVPQAATGSDNDPLLTITDAVGYIPIYEADLAKAALEFAYDVNNAAQFTGTFNRVGYLFELQTPNNPKQWAWTSMDAFTPDIKLIGIPMQSTGARFQQKVTNLFIASNVSTIPQGAVDFGVIEFWPTRYQGTNAANIEGATDEFDFGDQITDNGNYGSMQVHNLRAKQTVWAFNKWPAKSKAEMGIGPSTGRSKDWTFTDNGESYSFKRLRVFVKPAP